MKTSSLPPDTLSTEEIPTPTERQQSPASRSIPSLYVLKAICAFFVVVQHIHLAFCRHIKPITTTAVLVFFIITGYFLYVKAREKGERRVLAHLLKHALVITITVNIIAFLYHYCIIGNIAELLTMSPYELLQANQAGIYYSYWYLKALCVSLFVLYILSLTLPIRALTCLMTFLPLLFVGSIILGSSHFLTHDNPLVGELYRQALVIGIPCIACGYLIAKYEQSLIRSPWSSFSCLLLLSAGACVERYIPVMQTFQIGHDYWTLTLPLAATMFLVCLKHRAWGPQPLVSLGKYHSANIYYLHLGVYESLWIWCPALLSLPVLHSLQAVLVFLICIPLSMGINLVSHRLTAFLSRNKSHKSAQTE